MCLLSDGTTTQLQANGTHKNQMGQAEGRSEHTRTRTHPLSSSLVISLPLSVVPLHHSLFSLGTSLTANKPCRGPPLVSMVAIQYAPVASPAQHLLPWQEMMVVVETKVGFVYVLVGLSPGTRT